MIERPAFPPPIQKQLQEQGPLSFSQESQWFLQKLNPAGNASNLSYLYRFTGGVDRVILGLALNRLILRHPIFRTVYPGQIGKPMQVVQPFEPVVMEYMDYSRLPEVERQSSFRGYISRQAYQPYDLEHGPLVRLALLHLGPEEDCLFFGTHHIGSDAWSRGILSTELAQCYQALLSGQEPGLPELPVTYLDYAAWQKTWLSGAILAGFLDHWKGKLSGELPVLALPTDHARPAMQTFHGASHYFEIEPALLARIKEFCLAQRLTPFHFLIGVYALLLMRYSGQEDLIIGCPFANRARPELDGLIGLFVNILPIRLNLSGDPSGTVLLERVRTVVLDAFTWQAGPFEAIVSELAPTRDLSRNPIFQVTINLRNVRRQGNSQTVGWMRENIHSQDAPIPFDLALEFEDEAGGMAACLQYNVDLFEPDTILRLASHYQNLLGELLAKASRPISELEMLSPAERAQILFEWNDTARSYPQVGGLTRQVEEQARRRPENPAVIFGDHQLTYRELNQRANQIAHYLRKFGAGPDIPVGVFLERSADLVPAILGILKSGSPYVPLDILYPQERCLEIIHDSGMKILVTQSSLAMGGLSADLAVLELDTQSGQLLAESEWDPVNAYHPESLAYIIYTSGSTGKPKGVEVTLGSLMNCMLSAQEITGLSEHDLSLTLTSPAFDISVFEFFAPLCLGATVAVASSEEIHDSLLLAGRIMKLPLTWMVATPSALQMVLDSGWPGKPGLKILSTGEALPADLAEHLAISCGDVYNLYGPTETTIWSSISRVFPGQAVTIGQPIANTSMFILDAHRQPVPVGGIGELFIGGLGLARGFHARLELTAEKFIPDPFSREPGARLFRTGDLARYKPNGEIELLGRLDSQVKLRGYRIELGEIEAAIRSHPEVSQATVLMHLTPAGIKQLVGYVIPIKGVTLEQAQLRAYLKEKLPLYMIPAAFVIMQAFPISPNGKIDRRALSAPHLDESLNQEYSAPRTPIEQRLSRIWMEVLGISGVELSDNFFDLGGNSLSAVQVMARIQQELGTTISIAKIFESPNFEDLATQVILALGKSAPAFAGSKAANGQEKFVT